MSKFSFGNIESEDAITYHFSTKDYGYYEFGFEDIVGEIFSNRPALLVFCDGTYGGEGRHMTVVIGFEVIDDEVYVYLSDGLGQFYRKMRFGTSATEGNIIYNDDLVTVCVE